MKYYINDPNNNKELFDMIKYQVNGSDMCFSADEADCIICYGGDGTLLDVFQKYPCKYIMPIRNHSRCSKHEMIDITKTKTNLMDIIECEYQNRKSIGLSELVIQNKNISKAMRCSLKINDKLYAENIIGDGVICSTPLGSTGYFKNIANTFFSVGLGIGFINNAQRMTNLIIDRTSKIEIEITRGDCVFAIDHLVGSIVEGEKIKFQFNESFGARLLNYKDVFMCNECRNKRHSAHVNTIYSVI